MTDLEKLKELALNAKNSGIGKLRQGKVYGALDREIGATSGPDWGGGEPDSAPMGRAYYCALAPMWAALLPADVLDLIAELEAARGVVEAASNFFNAAGPTEHVTQKANLRAALSHYQEVTK